MAEQMMVAAVDYSLSKEQYQLIGSEEACSDMLFAMKWPNGFRCARCDYHHAFKITTRRLPLFECSLCHYQESLITGTIMEGSRTKLSKWFHALLLVTCIPSGINAMQLKVAIGVTYKTAWLMLHKLRYAMGKADSRVKLSGIVRINSASYGRPHNPSFFRHSQEQPLLAGASISNVGEPVYVKIKQIPEEHLREKEVCPSGSLHFINQQVEPQTDDLQCVTARYSSRRFKPLIELSKKAGKTINMIYHGVGPKYLQAYLNEFCCRFNVEASGTSYFQHLSRLCASAAPVTYRALLTYSAAC